MQLFIHTTNVFWFFSNFRWMATAQKLSTRNVCRAWRVTKSVLFFRSVNTNVCCIVSTRQQNKYFWRSMFVLYMTAFYIIRSFSNRTLWKTLSPMDISFPETVGNCSFMRVMLKKMRLINFTIFSAMSRDDSGPLLNLPFVIPECFWVLKMINTVTVVQVSVLTDQVEVQGEKIRDLENCLEHHREKLNTTEQLLQQVVFVSPVWEWYGAAACFFLPLVL